jgi:hypothetical protein
MGEMMTPIVGLGALLPETALAFDAYIRTAETAMEPSLNGVAFFLGDLERVHRLECGEVPAELWGGSDAVRVPHGLIHDWVGACWIPGTTVTGVLAVVQDYDNHAKIYSPEVVESKLISRCDDDFRIRLRLLKKKIITVVLDTDHDVHYSRLDQFACCCFSRTTRISEVQNPGTPEERLLAADTGHGFLWRLYSYWKFQERNDGVFIECRAISLTRDIPRSLKWIVQPMVRSLPKESLINTLVATRRALSSGAAVHRSQIL